MTSTRNTFYRPVNKSTEIRLIDLEHCGELFRLFEVNREHLRRWHPWVDDLRSEEAVEKAVDSWQHLFEDKLACHAGIWFKGEFCGMVSFLNVDRVNRWTPLCYWLNEAHQGQGIMTACCRTMIDYGFAGWGFNRIAIECASENTRSRAIAERLGFKFEGMIRGIQWLHDRFVDAAMYGFLRSDYEAQRLAASETVVKPTAETLSKDSNPPDADRWGTVSPWNARLCRNS
ncbi:MAG TPA: GNAT family protein [Verrucomicrobiae bacterium]|jgi:ribosomal-protein-serine acetyltransferase